MGTDPRNGFLFFFSGTPLAVTGGLSAARFSAEPLMEVTTSWVVHVGCRYSFWSLSFPETLKVRCGPTATVELSDRVFKRELEGGALFSTLEKTDGGGRVREERLLTNGGGRVTVALKRRRL